jgi:hypothetical protein
MLAESRRPYPGELATPGEIFPLADEYRKAAHLPREAAAFQGLVTPTGGATLADYTNEISNFDADRWS